MSGWFSAVFCWNWLHALTQSAGGWLGEDVLWDFPPEKCEKCMFEEDHSSQPKSCTFPSLLRKSAQELWEIHPESAALIQLQESHVWPYLHPCGQVAACGNIFWTSSLSGFYFKAEGTLNIAGNAGIMEGGDSSTDVAVGAFNSSPCFWGLLFLAKSIFSWEFPEKPLGFSIFYLFTAFPHLEG